MSLFASLSVRTKLLLMLLAVGIGVDVLVGAVAFRNGARALEERSFAHLTSVRAAKAAEITRYVGTIRADVQTVAEGEPVATAVAELIPAYAALSAPPRPDDGSAWAAAHARVDPAIHAVVQRYGYYDLFVIDASSGAVVYTVAKEPDFATSLVDGPYAGSHLARAFERARTAPGDEVVLEDFAAYAPSNGAPAAFAATPIRRDGRVVAVLAVQLPVDRIDDIMTGGRQWEQDGLGHTGETYLVGGDGRMRSNSRFLFEDPSGLRARLVAAGVPAEDIDGVERFGTTILQLRVDSEATRAAAAGEAGTRVIHDYRDVPVLSSWAPLDIPDLQWSIVSEMDLSEARAPVQVLFRRLTAAALALFLPIFLAAVALSAQFVKPVLALVTATRAAGSGRLDVAVQMMSEDEFGELSDTFNAMVASLAEKNRAIEAKGAEQGRLLGVVGAIFGQHASKQVANALQTSPDSVEPDAEEREVTVLAGGLRGVSASAARVGPKQTLSTLNAWFEAANAIVEAHGGVVVEYRGASFLAVFGAPGPLPGHSEKATRCALAVRSRLAELNLGAVEIALGLHRGRVVAGHLGSAARMKYAVAGEAVDIAVGLEAAEQAVGTTLLMSEDVYEHLPEQLRVKVGFQGVVPIDGHTVRTFAF